MTTIRLLSGRLVDVPDAVVDRFVGLDRFGHRVIATDFVPGFTYPITDCCGASGKGSANVETGVCCRACYAEVDSSLGGVNPPIADPVRQAA